MSIDLNTCIGCNACVVACQAENNIPIVGRDQVIRGREMHWIRIDRYYSDGKHRDRSLWRARATARFPRIRRSRSSRWPASNASWRHARWSVRSTPRCTTRKGLNVMAYNRCVGTRYCANNCPYKVRRFNYFDWNKRATDALYLGPFGHQKEMPELLKMVKNPEVTVRMRGVMEKCTYCVQRIENARIQQKVKAAQAGNPGDVRCAMARSRPRASRSARSRRSCSATFLTEPAPCRRRRPQPRDYSVLGYLNTRPRTTYLGKLRNPNPRMPDYAGLPLSRREYQIKAEGAEGLKD